ncbi:MAG: hypothetical protein ACI9AR_000523 [Flavobacteriaceae bacterium]|jgi:hypothetical protein
MKKTITTVVAGVFFFIWNPAVTTGILWFQRTFLETQATFTEVYISIIGFFIILFCILFHIIKFKLYEKIHNKKA